MKRIRSAQLLDPENVDNRICHYFALFAPLARFDDDVFYGAADGDDLLPRGLRHPRVLHDDLLRELPGPEDLHGHALLARQAVLGEAPGVHDVAVGEPVEIRHVDDLEHLLERVVGKAAACDAPEQRHLASLEAEADAPARARLLALRALARRLAVTRAHAPSQALVFLR